MMLRKRMSHRFLLAVTGALILTLLKMPVAVVYGADSAQAKSSANKHRGKFKSRAEMDEELRKAAYIPPIGPLTVNEPLSDRKSAAQLLPAGPERVAIEIATERRMRAEVGAMNARHLEADRLLVPAPVPVTGVPVKGMEKFEESFAKLMRYWLVPGATVAIAKDGKLVYARGFGYADLPSKAKMQPETLFRIASISKAITAIATLKLCEQGKLTLDAQPLPTLGLKARNGRWDNMLDKITVRQLLQCSGGWDRARSGDPMFVPIIREAAMKVSPSLRPTTDSIQRYWLSRNLDFLPGSHFAYSNFGYSLLGKIIENKSGKKYTDYVREELFVPLGIKRPMPGRTLELAQGETTYYPFPSQEHNRSIFPNYKGSVPLPYGADFALECMTADTGWLASAIDLVRFTSSIASDKPVASPISKASFAEMISRPKVPEWHDEKLYFAMGWEADVSKGENKLRLSRQGSLAGVMTYVVNRPDGYTFAYFVNTRPYLAGQFHQDCVKVIENGLASKPVWPATDLFASFN